MATATSEELKVLNIKRGYVKGKITHFNKFVEGFDPTPQTINQLKTRLALFEPVWTEFEEIQSQIEMLHNDPESQLNDRLKFEHDFCTLVGDAKTIIERFTVHTLPNELVQAASNSPNPTNSLNSQRVKLPVLSLPKFSGSYDEWLSFRDRFNSSINDDISLSNVDKFQYLQSCLSGEAQETIKSLAICEGNYAIAWKKLEDRYEDKRLLVQSHITALFNISNINKKSANSIKRVIDTIGTHLQCLESLGVDTSSWGLMIIHFVRQKFDEDTLHKWESIDFPQLPSLSDLIKFLTKLYKTLEASSDLNKQNHKTHNNYNNSFQNRRISCTATSYHPKCGICESNHMLHQCPAFLELSVKARYNKISQLKLCKNCFKSNHQTSNCQSVFSCRQCRKKHHTLLHFDNNQPKNNEQIENTTTTINNANISSNASASSINSSVLTTALANNPTGNDNNYQVSSQVLLSTVVVTAFDKYNQGHSCRAVLDVGSQSNFVTQAFFNKLNLHSTVSNACVSGISQSNINIPRSTNIKIKSRENTYSKDIECLILPKITANLPTFSFNASNLKIPGNIILADPNFNITSQVDLLMGAQLFWELLCVGQFQLGKNLPYLQKTHFGWIVGGAINYNINNQNNRACLLSLDQQLLKFWEIEEYDNVKKPLTSLELECENHFLNNYYRKPTGEFVVSLPFSQISKPLGLSKQFALKRFYSLENRLIKNQELYQDYKQFMNEYVELGHMELVPSEIATNLGTSTSAYVLPHHAVVKNSSTTTKTRVVFDGSAKTTTGVSLNDNLLAGPTIQQSLFSILLRFRTYKYALTADIEKMYRQIKVNEGDTCYQLILWRNNCTDTVETYKLTTVTYGTTSAPFLAIRCLFQLAEDEREICHQSSAIIKRDFYVDDLLTGANSVEEAIKLRNNISSILSKGNFHLRKWASNDQRLLPNLEINIDNSIININKEGYTKTLGLLWNCESDIFKYSITLPEINNKVTKRSILSTISQIFDPLGLIGPVIIIAKIILQKLWSLKLNWDESVPLSLHTEWCQYLQKISHLNEIQIPRNTVIDEPQCVELHGFCDASEYAYGICIYLKSTNKFNITTVNLLCAKSRVAPLKTISIPRLELCGAVLLVKFMQQVINSLSNINNHKVFYWTDSTIVLSWIFDSPSRWKTFVANRVTEIQNVTRSEQWRHVESTNNPADIVSRGMTPEQLLKSKLWWNGPEFLNNYLSENYSHVPKIDEQITLEVRNPKSIIFMAVEAERDEHPKTTDCEIDFSIIKRYSSFSRLKRVIAYCFRWYDVYKANKIMSKETVKNKHFKNTISGPELQRAHNTIIKIVQAEYFSKEIRHLSQTRQVPNNSKVLCLRPFLDNNGIMRVGGRLRHANLNFDSKHQILLPKQHFVSKQIILEYHKTNLHSGPLLTLNSVRNKYWVLSGRSVVRKILHSCVTCFRANPSSNQQLMGDLPPARVLPARPFIKCGIDYAGPIYIKGPERSKVKVKSYIAVFVCFATKSIHIELVCGLSSESFLGALKRFIARRGHVSDFYSDNGTTFVGANKELKDLRALFLSDTFNSNIISFLTAKNINWHFIPPSAPNFGGIWEAGVKSIKYYLKRVAGNAFLTYEELYTLLTQIEACLNSRPLTPLSNDPNDLEPLTPAHFLIGDSLIAPVEPTLMDLNENRLSRWQRIQQLTQHFWKRWSNEYLTGLQERTKWKRLASNTPILPNTIVVLKEDNLPPLQWRLGRVSAVHPGADGLVRVEAAQRYTDTSWRLFRQSQKNCLIANPPPPVPETEPHKTSTYDISPSSGSENSNVDSNSNESFDKENVHKNENQRQDKKATETRKVVQIERVEVLYEPIEKKVEVDLHSHDEPYKNGSEINNKMLRSTSYNGYGEALTSQPRSNRPSSSVQGNMDLSYVTERIISMWFPASVTSHSYRQGQRQAAHMLGNKHGDNYMVFNLSEPKRALRSEHKYVKEAGWTPSLAPPLERLCSVCKEIDSWLSKDVHRIAVLHSRGSKEKLGVIVAAYMHYSSICGTAEQALDRFSMRKFLDDNVGPLKLPSNKRYVDYFAGLLSHSIKINAAPLFLTHVTVLGAPSFQNGGCKAFLKLYEGHTSVYTSGVYTVSSGISQFTVNVSGERKRGLQLRGDILIKCYHRGLDNDRETIFACQFHTCAVADHTLSFTRQELDFASIDSRFPVDGAVELHFSSGPEGRHPAPAPTPAVPFTAGNDDPVIRADSPFNVEEYDEEDSDSDDVNHTFGPLDGSIYATIAKKPELSPGAVSSPLTVSMDSGISSAGHQQNANTNASGSPPPTAQPSPLTPEDQHRELDELLSDMMLTVQSIPDFKPTNSGARGATQDFSLDNVRFIDEEDKHNPYKREYQREEDKEIPYHARENSKPFSYGINQDMIGESKGLSSPSLVRKASVNKSHGDTLAKVQTGVYPSTKPVPKFENEPSSNYNSQYSTLGKYSYSPTPHRKNPPQERDAIDDIFTQSALNAQPAKREFREEYFKDERKRFDPLKRSFTDGTLRKSPEKVSFKSSSAVTSPFSDSESLSPPGQFRNNTKSPEFHESYTNGNLTWLQRQQQKLKERREVRLREERQPHETRLFSELKQVQSRHMRPTASHRLDGYTSDTTAFADDDDDYTIPLHINTMQRNGVTPSSSQYSTLKSNYSTVTKNERPFMTVKRAHEKYSQASDPAAALAAIPLGQIRRPPSRGVGQDQVDSGLLSLVEQKSQYSTQQHPNQYPATSEPSRYNQQATVGIANGSSAESSLRDENSRLDALDDLIANLSSGSEHSSNSPNTTAWPQYEQSSYSWRSQSTPNDADTSPSHSSSPRPQTPAFPVLARTPYLNASTPSVQFDLPHERLPPKSPTTQRKDRPTSPSDLNGVSDGEYRHATAQRSVSATGYREQNGSSSPTVYYGHSRRGSVASSANDQSPHEVSAAHVKIVRDTSKFWYKPGISREEAISMLRDQSPGTFVVRDSNSFPGAFGLALRVATVPSNLQNKSNGSDELIRHFLIEPTPKGVRLKGCQNEPVFSSLSALIYQHSITQIALPCRLVLPEGDLRYDSRNNSQAFQQQIQIQGAACNVLYLCTLEMESLTGPQAVKKAVIQLLQKSPQPDTVVVHFKVNGQGITLTDNKRKVFFRKHYPINTISHCGLDPEEHRWMVNTEDTGSSKSSNRIFGFVARKPNVSNPDNQCHLFAELDPDQPASAIVNFVNKVLTSNGIKPNIV